MQKTMTVTIDTDLLEEWEITPFRVQRAFFNQFGLIPAEVEVK